MFMPIGPFPDFDACVAHMTKPREEGGGGYDEETARKVCGKMQAELEESFSWAGDLEVLKPYQRLIRGKAMHPIKTFHAHEWPSLRVYLEEELKKSADTLIGKPLFLDHTRPLNGSVYGAHYEDGALEYVAGLEDEDVLRMIRDDQVKHASVQFEWKTLENVNGMAPRGITFQHLSLLKDMEPGDPMSTVEIWESIIKRLKEAKSLRADSETSPKLNKKGESELSEQIVEPSIEDRVKSLEQSIDNICSRIAEVEGVLTAKIETLVALVPHVEVREPSGTRQIAEALWDTDYINNLDDDCFAYIEPGGEKDEQGKTTPRSLRHFPYKNAQGNLSPDHVRNGLARLGQELGDWATADAKAQIKKKLCAAAKELEIESEVCGLEEQAGEEPPRAGEPKTDKERLIAHFGEEVATKLLELIGEEAYKLLPPRGTKAQIHVLTEQKKELREESERIRKPGEAIIPSTVTDRINKQEIVKKLKEAVYERIPRHWGRGPYEQNRRIKKLIQELQSSS